MSTTPPELNIQDPTTSFVVCPTTIGETSEWTATMLSDTTSKEALQKIPKTLTVQTELEYNTLTHSLKKLVTSADIYSKPDRTEIILDGLPAEDALEKLAEAINTVQDSQFLGELTLWPTTDFFGDLRKIIIPSKDRPSVYQNVASLLIRSEPDLLKIVNGVNDMMDPMYLAHAMSLYGTSFSKPLKSVQLVSYTDLPTASLFTIPADTFTIFFPNCHAYQARSLYEGMAKNLEVKEWRIYSTGSYFEELEETFEKWRSKEGILPAEKVTFVGEEETKRVASEWVRAVSHA